MSLQAPNIPALSSKVDTEVKRALEAIKGWFTQVSSQGGVSTHNSTSTAISTVPTYTPPYNGASPPQIQNFRVTGAFRTIMLSWDTISFTDLAYVEVWRNTATSPGVSDLGTAQLIGTTISAMYSDVPPNASLSVEYFYWVRGKSIYGIYGPFNATLGTVGHTANDPAYMLEVLSGQIMNSHLQADLSASITGTGTEFDAMGEALLAQIVAGDTSASTGHAAIIEERTTRESELLAEANYRLALGVVVADNHTYIIDNYYTSAGTDTAIAEKTEVLTASVGDATAAIAVEQEVRATTIAAIFSETAEYEPNKCVMYGTPLKLYRNKTGATITAGVWNPTQWTEIPSDLYGQYTVRVDVNGNVGGYGLDNDGKTSKMYISVDEFAIINPHAVTGTIPPVVVLTTPQTYGTVTLPAGAYINGANIVEATIKGAAIENLAVDTAKISDAAIVTAKIADGSITDLKIGNIIQSDPVGNPYSALNHTGWLIAKDGGCHFNGDSSFSGKVTFTSNPRNSAGNLITVDNNSISIVEQNLVSNSTFTADSDWTFVSVGHAFSGADAARHLSLNATQSDGAALNALAKNALINFTKAPTFGSTILIVPDAPYTSAYTGVMSGVVTGVTPFTNYRIDVYATTDIDYLQSSCVLDAGGAWTATAYGTGLKTMKLVLISSGAIIAEFYDTTGIVRSYDVPSSDPGYIYIKDRCYTYDHAVAISAACCMGDMAFAELLVDGAIIIMTQNSNSWPFAVGHKTGVAPDFPYIRTGALAWGVYALAYFLQTFPASTKAAAVTAKLDLLTAVLTGYIVAEEGYQQHLVRGGTGRYVADVFDPTYVIGWCSTEHNIDTWFALDLAATVRSNSTWRTAADNLKAAMLANCWLESEGRFVQGVSSQTVKDTNHALDCSSWGSILLTAWGETTKSARALEHCDAYWTTSGTVQGYRPYTPAGGYPSAGTGVWAEGTFGVVAARFAAGQLNQGAGDYMPLASIVDERGLPYSTERDYLYELSNWYSVAAIGWMQIAVQPNAFWRINQDNAQYLSAAGSLIGGGYARSSNITVEPNTEYLLAMNMKSSDGTSVVASGFGVQDSSGAYSFGYYGEGTDVNLTSAWDRHYFRFTTPAALTSVHIRLRPPTVVGSATIDYDNIVLGKGNTESLKLIGVEAGATVGATAAQAATLATAASNASSAVAATNNWVKPGQTTIDGNKIWTGDAYVDTLQIMDNAVTFSSATSRNTQQSFAANSAWADYLTWEYVNPFSVAVSVNIIVTYVGGNTLWLGSTPTIFQVRVVDNIGTVIFDTTTMLSATLVKLLSIPANTNRTYSIQMRNDANVSSATGEHASILLIGAAK